MEPAKVRDLTVVCFKWFDPRGRWNDRFLYGPEHVNRLRRMLSRHLGIPHQLVCITDDPSGIDPGIRTYEIDRGLLALGGCYARLSLFNPETQRRIGGSRFLAIDLDCVIADDFTSLIEVTDEFRIWAGMRETQYNCSMFLLAAGARRQVWDEFDPHRSPERAREAGYRGTDQAWISLVLGKGERVWNASRDGVLSYKRHCSNRRSLPSGARIVFFHGPVDPSLNDLQRRHPWILQHWI